MTMFSKILIANRGEIACRVIKTARQLGLLGLTAVLLTAGGSAFAQPKDRIVAAREILDGIMDAVGHFVLAVQLCKAGDIEPWFHVVSSIDRRYEHCVRQDAVWTELGRGWEAERAKADGIVDPAVGTFAYIRKMRDLPEDIRKIGVDAFCVSAPWRIALDPRNDTATERANFARINPKSDINEFVRATKGIRNLGRNKSWWESPCDQFWPAGYALKGK